MKKADGFLSIEAIVTCPECGDHFDLFDISKLKEDGYLYHELLDGGNGFGTEHLGDVIECPECQKHIKIGEITW